MDKNENDDDAEENGEEEGEAPPVSSFRGGAVSPGGTVLLLAPIWEVFPSRMGTRSCERRGDGGDGAAPGEDFVGVTRPSVNDSPSVAHRRVSSRACGVSRSSACSPLPRGRPDNLSTSGTAAAGGVHVMPRGRVRFCSSPFFFLLIFFCCSSCLRRFSSQSADSTDHHEKAMEFGGSTGGPSA